MDSNIQKKVKDWTEDKYLVWSKDVAFCFSLSHGKYPLNHKE